MKDLQKIASRIFIIASILFGLVGILVIVTSPANGEDPALWQMKTLAILVFVILSSFGVSVGSKYLSDK